MSLWVVVVVVGIEISWVVIVALCARPGRGRSRDSNILKFMHIYPGYTNPIGLLLSF